MVQDIICQVCPLLACLALPGRYWQHASGKFNPALAGPGVSHLIYETPNCAFQGKVQIDVQTGPSVSLISPAQNVICSEAEVALELTEDPAATYDWYFKPTGSDAFGFIGTNGAMKNVTNPGQYFARVFNKFCSTESPILTVSIESVEVVIGPQPVVCNHNQGIQLEVSVTTVIGKVPEF